MDATMAHPNHLVVTLRLRKQGQGWIQRMQKRQVPPGAILGMPFWRLIHPSWKVRWKKMNQEYVLTFWANRGHPCAFSRHEPRC